MTKENFMVFVNKESFDDMVGTWNYHHKAGNLTNQGEKKRELMNSLFEWKNNNYNEECFENVERLYISCVECNIDLTHFFNIM